MKHNHLNLENHLKIYEPIIKSLDLNNTFIKDKKESLDLLFKTGIADKTICDLCNPSKMNKMHENMIFMMLRDNFVREFGFTLLNDSLIKALSEQLSNLKIIEAGAGNGFLSYQLQKNNINITPVDKYVEDNKFVSANNYTQIIECDAIKYIKENQDFDAVLLSWPYMNNFALHLLKGMKSGQKLFYVGEYHGCCANDQFFDLLDQKTQIDQMATDILNFYQICWPGIHDRWGVYTIK